MSIASSTGQTFLFNDRPSLSNANVRSSDSDIPDGGPDLSFIGEVANNLEHTDNATRDYYSKFANIRNFANTMWKNYNIDITNPDMSDPNAVRANQMFLKAYADMKVSANQLQRGWDTRKAMQGKPNMVRRTEFGEAPTTEDDYINVGHTDSVKELGKYYNQTVYDKGALSEIKRHKSHTLQQLRDQIANETNPSRRGALESHLSYLQEVEPLYDDTRDVADRLARERLEDKESGYVSGKEVYLAELYTALQKGYETNDDSALLNFVSSNPKVMDAKVIREDGRTILRYREKVGTIKGVPQLESRDIYLDNADQGLEGLGNIIGKSVTYEDVNVLQTKESYRRKANEQLGDNEYRPFQGRTIPVKNMSGETENLTFDQYNETLSKRIENSLLKMKISRQTYGTSGAKEVESLIHINPDSGVELNMPNSERFVGEYSKDHEVKITGNEKITSIHVYNANYSGGFFSGSKKGPYVGIRFVNSQGVDDYFEVPALEGEDQTYLSDPLNDIIKDNVNIIFNHKAGGKSPNFSGLEESQFVPTRISGSKSSSSTSTNPIDQQQQGGTNVAPSVGDGDEIFNQNK